MFCCDNINFNNYAACYLGAEFNSIFFNFSVSLYYTFYSNYLQSQYAVTAPIFP